MKRELVRSGQAQPVISQAAELLWDLKQTPKSPKVGQTLTGQMMPIQAGNSTRDIQNPRRLVLPEHESGGVFLVVSVVTMSSSISWSVRLTTPESWQGLERETVLCYYLEAPCSPRALVIDCLASSWWLSLGRLKSLWPRGMWSGSFRFRYDLFLVQCLLSDSPRSEQRASHSCCHIGRSSWCLLPLLWGLHSQVVRQKKEIPFPLMCFLTTK